MTTKQPVDARHGQRPTANLAAAGTNSFGADRTATATPREFPVLFQIADLSQFQVVAPRAETAKRDRFAKRELPTSGPKNKDRGNSPSDAAPSETKPAEAKVAAPPLATPPLTVVDAAPLVNAASPALDAAEKKEPPTAPPPAVAASEPLSLRQRAEMRQKRRAATPTVEPKKASGDWFSTHGKVIVVGFVIALVITIYAARKGGDAPAPTGEIASPQANVHSSPSAGKDDSPAQATKLTAKNSDAGSAGQTADPSPARLAEDAATKESKRSDDAALKLNAPKTSAKSPGAGQPSEKSLFPWNDKDAPRTATRPPPPALAPEAPSQEALVAPAEKAARPAEKPLPPPAEAEPQSSVYGDDAPSADQPAEAIQYPVTNPDAAPAAASPTAPPKVGPPAASRPSARSRPAGAISSCLFPASNPLCKRTML